MQVVHGVCDLGWRKLLRIKVKITEGTKGVDDRGGEALLHCILNINTMAKSLRSKWKRKMKAEKRVRYGQKERERLEKMLAQAGEDEKERQEQKEKEKMELEPQVLGEVKIF